MSVEVPVPESKDGIYFNVCMHLSIRVRRGGLTDQDRAELASHYGLREALLLRCDRALLAYGPKVGQPQCRKARMEAVRRLMERGKEPWDPEFREERTQALQRIQAAAPETEVTREAKAADNALRAALGLPPAFDLPPEEDVARRGEVCLPFACQKEYWDYYYLDSDISNISRHRRLTDEERADEERATWWAADGVSSPPSPPVTLTDEERAARRAALAERYGVSEALLVVSSPPSPPVTLTDEERAALCAALAERYGVSEALLVRCERAFRDHHFLVFQERWRQARLEAMRYMNALGKDILTDECGDETVQRFRRISAAAPENEITRECEAARTALRATFGLLPVEEGEPTILVFRSASTDG